MNTGKAAVLIVMAVIIVPMLVGYAWPQDKAENLGWESGESHDITSSIKTSTIPTYAMDKTVISPAWASAGSGYVDTISGVFTVPSSTATADLVDWIIAGAFMNLRSAIDAAPEDAEITASLTVATMPDAPLAPKRPTVGIPTSIYDGSESTSYTNVGQLSAASVTWQDGTAISWTANGYTITPDTPAWDQRNIEIYNVMDTNYTYRLTISTAYAPQPTTNTIIKLPNQTIRGNLSVSLTNVTESTTTIQDVNHGLALMTIIGPTGEISGRISSGTTYHDIPAIGTISTIPWVQWSWDSVTDTVMMAAMTGAVNSGQVFRSESQAVDIDPVQTWTITTTASGAWRPYVSAYDSYTAVGSTLGIVDAAIRGNLYYPDGSWQIQIRQPSTIGSSLTVGGIEYPIIGGKISVDGEDIAVRNITILATGNGDGTSDLYVDSRLVASSVTNPTIILGGMWNGSIILSDVDSYTYYTYDKTWGSFGLDVTGFCAVGLLTSLMAFLACIVAGKRSGGRFGLLALVAGICALFFFVVLSGQMPE